MPVSQPKVTPQFSTLVPSICITSREAEVCPHRPSLKNSWTLELSMCIHLCIPTSGRGII